MRIRGVLVHAIADDLLYPTADISQTRRSAVFHGIDYGRPRVDPLHGLTWSVPTFPPCFVSDNLLQKIED